MQRDKFPRTGKRGVPQQFPRRLYNMLEHETTEAETNGKEPILAWSKTGKAFGISDVAMFANQVLPKHFKTSKFSSFQRNLNLVSSCISSSYLQTRLMHDKKFLWI